jgi:triosephosphate isomerase
VATKRKTLIIGNWKMNLNIQEASLYVHELSKLITIHPDIEVVLAPTMLALPAVSLQIKRRQFKLAAQNVYWRDEGAYTGEVSAAMLRGVCEYVIVGHSERRHIFHESDKTIRMKVQAVVRSGLRPILCVGETADERVHNETKHVLTDQLTAGLANITSEEMKDVMIAYEPVWAIGTGRNATVHDAAQAAQMIRHHIAAHFGEKVAKKTLVLYGGSVTGDNAQSYVNDATIDGLLVGGASLRAKEFQQIVKGAHHKKGGA